MRTPRSGGNVVRDDLAGQVEVSGLRPRQLARAGARQRARRDQFDDRRDAGDRADALADLVAQAAAFLIVGDAAVDEDSGSLLARRTCDREGSNVARLE